MTQPPTPDDSTGFPARLAPGGQRGPSSRFLSRATRFKLAAMVLVVMSGLAGTGLACWLRPPDVSDQAADPPSGPLAHFFRGWDKPDLVIVVTGDQHGYLLPCGCSKPQKGGLERRYNFMQLLREKGWPVAAVDLGNVPQVKAPAELPNIQGLIKYRYAMRAMKEMGYTAVGIGDYEMSMPLARTLDEYAINDHKPRVVSADLLDRDNFPDETSAWQQADPIKGTDLKLGVTGVMGPSVFDLSQKKDPSVHFSNSTPALNATLKEMDGKGVDLRVLLYMGSISQGRPGSPAEAVACAEAFPQFPLVVAVDDSDLPRSDPVWATNPKTAAKTMIVSLGEKGKYVGVVGVFRTGKPAQPFDLRYQLVEMSEDFTTPAAAEKGQPILKLMNEYTEELRKENYLSKYKQVPHYMQTTAVGKPPVFVGSERCLSCHPTAAKVWEGSAHHHAYQTLVDAKRPSNRQYDPECIVCHTIGFGYQSGFKSAAETPKLENVGCESCHGPGSLHSNNPADPEQLKRMNPWKAPPGEKPEEKKRRERRIDDACQKCHDPENDVNWSFERNWPKIRHDTPADQKADEPDKK